jgi:hypothetical protein
LNGMNITGIRFEDIQANAFRQHGFI